jgi:hypothetical protein
LIDPLEQSIEDNLGLARIDNSSISRHAPSSLSSANVK